MGVFNGIIEGLGRALAFLYDLIPSYGIAIILLTVMVRLALLPLTIKQTRSMQAMQKIQPELKKLQAKHKGDRQRLNEETMKLYKEHAVNPLGGCLPLILQIPIFISLYRVFAGCGQFIGNTKKCLTNYIGVQHLPQRSALHAAIIAGHAGFLGMNLGLSPAEALKVKGMVGVLPYALMIALMGFTTWYQQRQIQGAQSGQQAAQMQMLGKIMPIMLIVFSINLPAGVSLYWVASNVWTIGQQWALLGRNRPAPADANDAPGGAKGAQGGGRPATKPVVPMPKKNGSGNSKVESNRKNAGGDRKGGRGGASGSTKSSKRSKKR